MAEQSRPDMTRRRSSLGRAFDRVRDAMKRRRSSAAAVATLQSPRREEPTTAAPALADEPRVEPQESAKQDEGTITETRAAGPHESKADSQLVPDDGLQDDEDVNEEPLTPSFSSRAGINDDKAKALYARYGIKYQPRDPAASSDSTSPNKRRRVERPVRIRIHWTCHQCERQFGSDRACTDCGHRRCGDCARSPPKRVRAIVDEAKQMQEQAASKDQILAAISPNTVAAPADARVTSGEPLELDEDDAEGLDFAQLTMEQRPRSGIKLVMRPRKGAGEGDVPFEPAMVATVKRVYRKPRQRIRWQCDKCDSIFADSTTCHVCNHRRCGDCVRSPEKRPPRQPDPAVLQSLNDKIEAWQRQRSQAPENITTELEPEPGLS